MKKGINLRRILTWVFFVLLGWKFIVPIVTGPIDRKKQEIAQIREVIEELKERMSNFARYSKTIRNTGKHSLPEDVTVASIRYQEWLRQVCQQAGIEFPAISVKDPSTMDGLGYKFQASIRTKSRLASAGDLLDLLCAASITHRIIGYKLHDWESIENKLQMDVELEAFSMKDNPTFDPSLFSQTIQTRGLGSFLDERSFFSRFVPTRPRQSEIAVSLEEPKEEVVLSVPQKVDILNLVRFVGVLEKDGSSKALFRDGNLNRDFVVGLNSELQIGSFEAKLVRLVDDQAIFLLGSKEISVKLGHTIRQSLGTNSKIQSIQ